MIIVGNVICSSLLTYPTSNLLCINNELRSSDPRHEPFVKTCNGWCVEVVRRVDGTSDQARPRRGPMLISEAMGTLRWSIGVIRPNNGGSLWCTIFYSGLELSGSSRKKWLLVASKPPITKLKDCPCSIYYGGEYHCGGGGVVAM